MTSLIPILKLLDRFLSPYQRKMVAVDLFRARFLAFSILFSIPCCFVPAVVYLTRSSGATLWIYEGLAHLSVCMVLLWKLRQTKAYHRIAALFLIWAHGLFIFVLWVIPSVFSLTYLWMPCLTVVSSLSFGVRGSCLSSAGLTFISAANILYLSHQGHPWNAMSMEEFTEQILLQIVGSMLFMVTVTVLYESMRELSDHHQARQRLLAARHAHTGAVGELVAHVAHEVNNPLGILQGSVTRLKLQLERNEWPHDARKLFVHMQQSYARIIRVQDALSVFAFGNQHEPFVGSDVRILLKNVQLAMMPQAQAQHVQLEFTNRCLKNEILCQTHQLVYVLCCLIENALDACRDHPTPSIGVEVHEDESALFFVVNDNGKGIDPSLQERVFQPFFTTKVGGSAQGLGLSVSLGILAEHGGEIYFESRPGATTFTFRIPCDLTQAVKIRKGA